jgi:hypothetical protein
MAQQIPKLNFDEVKCSVPLFNKLISTLHQMPYAQVAQLIQEIKDGFMPVPRDVPQRNPQRDTPPVAPAATTDDVEAELVHGGGNADL